VNAKIALGILLSTALAATSACTSKPVSARSDADGSTVPASASQLPDHSLPRGFESFSDPRSSGRLLFAKLPPGSASARAVMRNGLAALKTYFDAAPELEGAVSDPQDQVVEVIISATLRGQPLRGVATAAVAPGGSTFGLVLDRPQSLKSSFPALSQRLTQEMPRSAGAAAPFDLSPPTQWSRQSGGDRSCAADLPSGWRITSCNQGVMSILGPHHEYINLGMMFFVSTLPGSIGLASPYLQPVPAFAFFMNYSNRVNRQTGVNIEDVPGPVLEAKAVPAPMPNGTGAYLLEECTVNRQPYKIFALVYTAPNLMAGWTFYTSYVSAPADLFASEFADLMRIWGSWKVDDRVYLHELEQTLESMNETRDILSRGSERQMHAYDNLEESMGLIIRGEERVENHSLGGRADVYTEDSDAVLHACQQRGYDCRRVPFNELTRP
jgi:hypothetical protein